MKIDPEKCYCPIKAISMNGEVAEKLFRPCMCGIFNPHRAAKLLRAMAKPS